MNLKLNNMAKLKIKIIGYMFVFTIVSTIIGSTFYVALDCPCFIGLAQCVSEFFAFYKSLIGIGECIFEIIKEKAKADGAKNATEKNK